MKVGMLEDTYKVVVKEVGDLSPGPDELLIKTKYAGICGSDLHSFKGIHPFRKAPVVLGHELSGTIARVGKAVKGFCVGDRVTVMPLVACKNCPQCERGNENVCLNKTVPGIKGWQGTFAEYAAVDECWLYPTPGEVSDQDAAAVALAGLLRDEIGAAGTGR